MSYTFLDGIPATNYESLDLGMSRPEQQLEKQSTEIGSFWRQESLKQS